MLKERRDERWVQRCDPINSHSLSSLLHNFLYFMHILEQRFILFCLFFYVLSTSRSYLPSSMPFLSSFLVLFYACLYSLEFLIFYFLFYVFLVFIFIISYFHFQGLAVVNLHFKLGQSIIFREGSRAQASLLTFPPLISCYEQVFPFQAVLYLRWQSIILVLKIPKTGIKE